MIIVPTSELMDRCLSTGEPVFLSENGRIHAIILSIEEYERLCRADIIYRIREGIESAKKGHVRSIDEAERYIRGELDL